MSYRLKWRRSDLYMLKLCMSFSTYMLNKTNVIDCTVFLGSTLAIWMAASKASTDGLQRICVLELKQPLCTWLQSFLFNEILHASTWLSVGTFVWLGGLSVSKHMILSKHSIRPNLLSTWCACASSALVNTWDGHFRVLELHGMLPAEQINIKYLHTILRWGMESRRFLNTGSGFSFPYGSLPCT